MGLRATLRYASIPRLRGCCLTTGEKLAKNREQFQSAWAKADGSGDALDAVLSDILDVEVKCYRMSVKSSPSQSIKNKLTQAITIPGGLLCLTIRGPEGINARAAQMLVHQWRTNPNWEESVASVALVEEKDGQPHIAVVVERTPTQNGLRIKERLFPEVELRRTEPFGDEVLPAGNLLDLKSLASGLFVPEAWLDDVAWLLEDKQRVVFYGPPGTGKSFLALAIARFLQPSAALRRVVQLHPSYGYEDFFEGYRPAQEGGAKGLTLELRRGPFGDLVEAARGAVPDPAVLLLDEMNRGNLPRVFGELYFLMEHEEESTRLMYRPDASFVLPSNLYVIGTMNTADRSVAQLDQALRRRFHFVPLFPGEPPVDEMLRMYLEANVPSMKWAADVLDKANEVLGDRNVAIGPSHLMRDDLDDEVLERVWKHSVLPTIEDHFFGERDRVQEFALEALRQSLGG